LANDFQLINLTYPALKIVSSNFKQHTFLKSQIVTTSLRSYQNSDYDDFIKMVLDFYNDGSNHFDAHKAMNELQIQNTISRSVSHPEQIQINIFEFENTIAGYAITTCFWSNEYNGLVAILDELYVLPMYRSQGISSQYIQQLANIKDYKIIQLEVFKENANALKLYQKLNFKTIDRHFMNKLV